MSQENFGSDLTAQKQQNIETKKTNMNVQTGQELDAIGSAIAARDAERQRRATINTTAWTSEQEFGSIWGNVKNITASALKGGGDLIGRVDGIQETTEADRLLNLLDQPTRDALNKKLAGKEPLNEIEQALLRQEFDITPEGQIDQYSSPLKLGPERIFEKAKEMLKKGSDDKAYWTEDTWASRAYNPLRREKGERAIAENTNTFFDEWDKADDAWEKIKAFGDLTANQLDAIAENPGAMAEIFAESGFDMLISGNPIGAVVNFDSTRKDVLNKTLTKNTADGVLSTDKQAELKLESNLAGALDQASDFVMGGLSKVRLPIAGKNKTKEKDNKTPGTKSESNDSKKPKPVKRAAGFVGAAAGEFGTEYYQTLAEEDKVGKEFDREGNIAATNAGFTGIGATAVGTGPAQGLGLVNDVGSATKGYAERKINEAKQLNDAEKKQVNEDINQALSTGDTKNLVQISTNNDEKRQKVAVVENLRNIAARHETSLNNETDEKDAKSIEMLFRKSVYDVGSRLIEVDALLEKPELSKEDKASLQKEKAELTEANQYGRDYLNAIQAKQEQAENIDESIEEVVGAENRSNDVKVLAAKVLNRQAVNPESVSKENMEALLQSDNLDEVEKEQLRVVYAAREKREAAPGLESNTEQKASKNTGEVLRDVLVGGKGFLGLMDYRNQIVAAVQSGDVANAMSSLNALRAWAKRHTNKSVAFSKAFTPFENGPNPNLTEEQQAAVKYVADNYSANKKKPAFVNQYSGQIVMNMQQEAEALNATVQEMQLLMGESSILSRLQDATPSQPAANDTSTAPPQSTEVDTESESVTPNQTEEPSDASVEAAETTNDETPPFVPDNTESVTTTQQDGETVAADTTEAVDPEVEENNNEITQEEQAAVDEDPDENTDLAEKIKTVNRYNNKLDTQRNELLESVNDDAELDRRALEFLGLSEKPTEGEAKKDFTATRKRIKQEMLDDAKTLKERIQQGRDRVKELQGINEKYTAAEELISNNKDNVLGTWFAATRAKGLIGTVRDAVSKLRSLPDLALNYLPGTSQLTSQQRAAIKSFTDFEKAMADAFDSVTKHFDELKAERDKSNQERKTSNKKPLAEIDLAWNTHAFFTKDGQFTQAAKSAMSAVVYNWIAFSGKESIYSNDKSIAHVARIKEDQVNFQTRKMLQGKGETTAVMSRNLGRELTQMMGIGLNKETASNAELFKLQAQIGNVMIAAMLDQGILKGHNVDQKELYTAIVETMTENELKDMDPSQYKGILNTVSLNYDEVDSKRVPAKELNDIIEANKDTDRIINKLFDSQGNTRTPLLKPSESTPKIQKNTFKKVAAAIGDALNKAQNVKWGLNPETDTVFDLLTQDEKLAVSKVIPEEEIALMPFHAREAANAANEALKREVENYQEWRNTLKRNKGGLSAPFYFAYEVWRNQRIGIKSTLVNPQTSKVHRGLVSPKSWTKSISVGAGQSRDMFFLGLAQGIGIDIDKMTVPAALEALQKTLVENPIYVEAAQAINALQNEYRDNPEEAADLRADIVEAVRKGKEGTHTLHSLTNLAKFLAATDPSMDSDSLADLITDPNESDQTFTHDMWLEIDGITNGVVIGTMLYGNGNADSMADRLEAGGIYTDERSSFAEYKAQNGEDFYEQLASSWNQELQNLLYGARPEVVAMFNAIGDILLDGSNGTFTIKRALAKEPLMTNVYGAGQASLEKALGEQFVVAIEQRLQDILSDSATTEEQKRAQVKELNKQLRLLSGTQKDVYRLTSNLNDLLLQEPNPRLLKEIKQTVGINLGIPLEEAINKNFSEFKNNRKTYNEKINKFNELFVAIYENALENERKSLIGSGELTESDPLPAATAEEVRDRLIDVMPSMSSFFSKDPTEAMQALKTEYKPVEGKRIITQFTVMLRGLFSSNSAGKKERKQLQQPLHDLGFKEEIGVGPGIINIHGSDAAISISILGDEDIDVLNVHDGFPVSTEDAIAAAQKLNSKFIEVVTEINPYQDLINKLQTAIDYLKNNNDGSVTASLSKETIQELADLKKKLSEVEQLTTKEKNDLLSRITNVNQYFFEGGEHSTGNAPTQKKPATSVWGDLASKDAIPDEKVLAAEKELKKVSTVKEALKIFNAYGFQNSSWAYGLKLVNRLTDTIPKNLKFSVIEPDTLVPKGLETYVEGLKNSFGFYDPNTNTVYLTSSKFKNSGINPTTFAHEVIHGLTSYRIEFGENNPNSQEAKLNKALNDLLKELRNLDAPGVDGKRKFEHQLENIHELVAYGLSDIEFIQWLKEQSVTKRNTGRFVKAYKTFLDLIYKYVFKKKPTSDNALKQLHDMAIGLMEDQRTGTKEVSKAMPHAAKVKRMSPEELISELGRQTNLNADQVSRLQGVQGRIINTLSGSFGVSFTEAENALGDDVDQYLQHLADNTKPLLSDLDLYFKLDPAELYVGEQLYSVINDPLAKSSFPRHELYRVWKEAKAQLKPEDFITDPTAHNAEALAQQRYDYLFEPRLNNDFSFDAKAGKEVDNRISDHLTRFAVLAATHEPLRQKLAELSNSPTQPGKTFLARVESLVKSFFAKLKNVVNRNTGATGSLLKQQDALLTRLAQHTHRAKVQASKVNKLAEGADKLDEGLSNSVKAAVGKLGVTSLKNSDNGYLKAVGQLIDTNVNNRGNEFVKQLNRFTNKGKTNRKNWVGELIGEMTHATANFPKLFDMLRFSNRDNEQARRFVKTSLGKLVEKSFVTPLDKFKKSALTKALIMTDMPKLLELGYSMNDLGEILNDNTVLVKRIRATEKRLRDFKNGQYYINQSRALGLYMVDNVASNSALAKNAHNIAYMYGQPQLGSVKEKDATVAMDLIDELASLKAIQYTSDHNKDLAYQVMLEEANRADGQNGAEYILRQYTALQQESLDKLFDNDPSFMTKGFISEIHNPNLTVRWARAGSPEAAMLERQGYKAKPNHELSRDRNLDGNEKVTMYVINDGGMVQRLTGIMSFTSNALKGTNFRDAAMNAGNDNELQIGRELNYAIKNGPKVNQDLHTKDIEPSNNKDTHMIPVHDPMGNTVNYRYEASEAVREGVLDKHYGIDEILGGIASNIVDKTSTKQINRDTIDLLAEQFYGDKNSSEGGYITVGPESTDPRAKEVWDLLPYEAKQYAKQKFHGKRLMVHRDVFTMVFGYRKASVVDLFNRPKSELAVWQKLLRGTLENTVGRALGDRMVPLLKKGEKGWQEIIQMVKDIFVVKNVFTTLGNVISNTFLLTLTGVPLHRAVADQVVGWHHATRYNKMKREVYQLEQKALTTANPSLQRKYQQSIDEFRNEMSVSPAHELMEAGMFQTIVEDIDTAQDPFSYKSKFLENAEEFLGSKKLPKLFEFGKKLFIAQDTNLYELLNNPVQLSDFAGRYAQYKYYTQDSNNKLSEAEAMERITENFVNYDIPTSQELQYMNDMGLLLFTKYFLRIQKPILRMFSEKPASTLLKMMALNYFDVPNPMDSSFLSQNILSRFNNPFSSIVDAPDEIVTINGLLHVLGIK